MSALDLLKGKIGLLKLWLGIFVVTEVSLLGWLASNFGEEEGLGILKREPGFLIEKHSRLISIFYNSNQNI